MESQLIYKISKSLENKVDWVKQTSDSEWIHFLSTGSINKISVQDIIEKLFFNEKIFVVKQRNNSHELVKSELLKEIELNEDLLVWDSNFQNVMQIGHIGVLRYGRFSGKIFTPSPATP